MQTVKQATKKDGTLKYKQSFSRVTQTWVVKKIVENKKREYLDELMEVTIKTNPTSTVGHLPNLEPIPQNIAPVEKPDKEESIMNMTTRFKL